MLTVEDQLGAARALVVDAPRDPDLLALGCLARLEVVELFDKLGVIVRDLELVRVRVRLGVLEHCYARGRSAKVRRFVGGGGGEKRYDDGDIRSLTCRVRIS